jgi:hypothetical protein
MTRKKSKKAASSRPQKRRFRLTIEGQPMVVEYVANSRPGLGVFVFQSPHKPARRIPLSEYGRHTHLADMVAVEAEGSPEDYARSAALDFIRRVVNYNEATLKTISEKKLADLRKHYDLYDACKWHDPEKRDAYIALTENSEVRSAVEVGHAVRVVAVLDDDVVLDGWVTEVKKAPSPGVRHSPVTKRRSK